MSGPIKAEDISDEAFSAMYVPWQEEPTLKSVFAEIINAAIEAGLVSPPCYQPVLDGKPLVDDYGPTVFTTRQAVIDWFIERELCRESWGERHWKGQTE